MAVELSRWVDGAIGETREVLLIGESPIMLRVARWSDAGKFARWGETYVGRVRAVERHLRGAFVDLGLPVDGFLRLKGADREQARNGALLQVRVAREAARDKGPVLELIGPAGDQRIGRIAAPECDAEIDRAPDGGAEIREAIDSLIERSLSRTVPLRGGGRLIIEPTSALAAIDVDAGGRIGSRDPEQFALDLNLEAARAAAREIRLRGLGGLVAIDFVSMRAPTHRKLLEKALAEATKDDPWSVALAPLSRFGVLELSRGQLRAPLHERLCEPDGRKTPETVALEALRAVERQSRAGRGRMVTAHVAPEVARWLQQTDLLWRDALRARIGTNWVISERVGAQRESIDVEVGE